MGYCSKLSIAILALIIVPAGYLSAGESRSWLLIDSRELSLSLMEGDTQKKSFPGISLGRFGVTDVKVRGDRKTPLGEFEITSIKPNGRFYYFIGLNYPNLDHAERAYREGRIDEAERRAIIQSINAGRLPPQTTKLGGFIGIHGLGSGDPEIHELLNWTLGCVALTDEQIDRLLPWVRVGMRVVIR